MVLATAFGWNNVASIAAAVVLAFCFGYAFTLLPLVRSGLGMRRSLGTAFASDTVSITIMEIVDNAFIVVVPGALDAELGDALFWWSLAVSLVLAFWAALPINRWLIARGRGHAVAHALHGHH